MGLGLVVLSCHFQNFVWHGWEKRSCVRYMKVFNAKNAKLLKCYLLIARVLVYHGQFCLRAAFRALGIIVSYCCSVSITYYLVMTTLYFEFCYKWPLYLVFILSFGRFLISVGFLGIP